MHEEHRAVEDPRGHATRYDDEQRQQRRDRPHRGHDDHAHGQHAREPGRRERPQQPARAEEHEHGADHCGRCTALACDDDHDEVEGVEREVAAGDEKRRRPDERLAPEPGEAFADLAQDVPLRDRAFALERRPDEAERHDRDRVGDRVHQKRHDATRGEQQSTQGLSPENGGVFTRLVPGERIGKLLVSNDPP
jgi:hypothetical protein